MAANAVPFEPSPVVLSSLATAISASISQYESASHTSEKAVALRLIARSSEKLTKAATDPTDAQQAFHFQPHRNLCVRIAIDMGIFDKLTASEPTTVQEATKRTGTDPEFTMRIVRALGAIDVLKEVDEGTYMHTPPSRPWTNKSTQAYAKRQSDNVNFAMS